MYVGWVSAMNSVCVYVIYVCTSSAPMQRLATSCRLMDATGSG